MNLDGFNEISLARSNSKLGIHPASPRGWELYEQRAVDLGREAYVAETRALLAEQAAWRERLGTGLAARSAFLLRVLDRVDARLAQQIVDEAVAFRAGLNEAELGFQVTGPFVPDRPDAELLENMVEIWKRSSLQMHAVATVAGARYFHFLQPNLWVPGSKPFTEAERSQQQLQVREDYPDTVPESYPALIRAGEELTQHGVAFASLVDLFEDEPRTVYKDSCWHFNQLGVEQLAQAIGDAVAAGSR